MCVQFMSCVYGVNVHSIYCNVSFLIEKSVWNLSSSLHNFTHLSLLNSFLLLLVLSTFPILLKILNNYFFKWLADKSIIVIINYTVVFQSFSFFLDPAISYVFREPGFPGSKFFRIQVFLGPVPCSESRIWVQILEVTNAKQLYWNYASA